MTASRAANGSNTAAVNSARVNANVAAQNAARTSGGFTPNQTTANTAMQTAWSSMTPARQAAFQAANPTFDPSTLSTTNAINQYNPNTGKYEAVSGSGVYEHATPATPPPTPEPTTPAT